MRVEKAKIKVLCAKYFRQDFKPLVAGSFEKLNKEIGSQLALNLSFPKIDTQEAFHDRVGEHSRSQTENMVLNYFFIVFAKLRLGFPD